MDATPMTLGQEFGGYAHAGGQLGIERIDSGAAAASMQLALGRHRRRHRA